MVVPQNRRKYKQENFEETQKSRTTPQRYYYPANQRADRTMGWMCENNEKRMIFLCKHPTFVLCWTCLRWRSEQVVCRKDWIKKTFLMGFLYTIFFLFSFIGLIHSVQLTHVNETRFSNSFIEKRVSSCLQSLEKPRLFFFICWAYVHQNSQNMKLLFLHNVVIWTRPFYKRSL